MNSRESNEKKNDSNRMRSVLAQFIAVTIVTLLYIVVSFVIAMPTIVIPALSGISNQHNSDEYLKTTAVQASWLASLACLLKPLGSIVSAYVSDKLGRKRSMILVNIPLFAGWFILFRATTLWEIFAGFVILGVSVAIVVVPVMNFVGEICDSSIRSILIMYATIVASFAASLMYILNTLMAWRAIAFLSMAVPLTSIIALCFIPETPQWLLSKDRVGDAEKSLCWLRGWVSKDEVAQEFHEMQKHNDKSNQETSNSSPSLFEKIAEFRQKRTLHPLMINITMCVITQCTGILSMQPFIVQIFKAYDSPIEPDKAAAWLSTTTILANVVIICVVRFTGKRCLYLATATGAFLSSLVIAAFGFIYLPPGYNSFDQQNHFTLENKDVAYIPFIALFLKNFFIYAGVSSLPELYQCELFSFKARGMACAVISALNSLLLFFCTKTYYNLEVMLSLQGISMLYCVLTGVGLVLMYFILPETEGRTLEDIELHFADESTKITDRKIIRMVDKNRIFEEKKLLR